MKERLANAVCGDKEFGQTGLIEQVNEHSAYIENDKTFKNNTFGPQFFFQKIRNVLTLYFLTLNSLMLAIMECLIEG